MIAVFRLSSSVKPGRMDSSAYYVPYSTGRKTCANKVTTMSNHKGRPKRGQPQLRYCPSWWVFLDIPPTPRLQ